MADCLVDDTALQAGIIAHAMAAFDGACNDTETFALRIAPWETGRYAKSIRMGAPAMEDGITVSRRLGSPLRSAGVHERGGWMTAKRKQHGELRFMVNGQWVRVPSPDGIRVRATPTVVPAGRAFPRFMAARLRATPVRSVDYDRSGVPKADYRSGRVRVTAAPREPKPISRAEFERIAEEQASAFLQQQQRRTR